MRRIIRVNLQQFQLNGARARGRINRFASENIPFFFLLDFELERCLVVPEHDRPDGLMYTLDKNHTPPPFEQSFQWEAHPISYKKYKKAFDRIREHIQYGNTYLINLTFPTPVETDLTLDEVYRHARARFKLHIPGDCVVFSPEPFIRIRDGSVYTYPMKGTIDADLPDAKQRLLNDEKELAEHFTVVDLLRNDIGSISEKVDVLRFQYLEEIETHRGPILQMSSEIRGELPDDYRSNLGDLLFKMLPAGSVSGAPKQKTLDIIRDVEDGPRGYYSGVFGRYADGDLDSAVCIRYLEERDEGMIYRSGGGITFQSDARAEYEEMNQKVYVPLRNNSQL